MKKTSTGFFENKIQATLALILPVCLVYAKSLKSGFSSMDDQWLIVQNTAYPADLLQTFVYALAYNGLPAWQTITVYISLHK